MLAKSHQSNKAEDRKAKRAKLPDGGYLSKDAIYDYTDAIVSEVYVDICNGWSRSDVLQKLQEGGYKSQKKKLGQSQANTYYYAAKGRIKMDSDETTEEMRNTMFARYEALFQSCIDAYDHLGARSVLDSMSKLMGLNKKEAPDTAIQINNSTSGVTINFGFSKEDGD